MLISSGGIAFPEPDVANIGGITAWLRIARLAEQSGLPVTSRGLHDLHVHLLSAVPNASYLEYHGFGLNEFMINPLQFSNGYPVASNQMGHGVELDWITLQPHREA
jgi:L-alanine-DL-glutamate epimerase-like enolase superfamily enzyme